MAKRTVSKGVCEACHKEVSKSAMTRHIAGCPETQKAGKSGRTALLHHLVVESPGATEYWLHVEAPASATLAHLDAFLREIWLEYCGHLSAFRIGQQTYAVAPDPAAEQYTGTREKSMTAKIGPLVVRVRFWLDHRATRPGRGSTRRSGPGRPFAGARRAAPHHMRNLRSARGERLLAMQLGGWRVDVRSLRRRT